MLFPIIFTAMFQLIFYCISLAGIKITELDF